MIPSVFPTGIESILVGSIPPAPKNSSDSFDVNRHSLAPKPIRLGLVSTGFGFFCDCTNSMVAFADESVSPVDDDGHLVRFQRDIVPIFRDRCLECHGPDDAKNDSSESTIPSRCWAIWKPKMRIRACCLRIT